MKTVEATEAAANFETFLDDVHSRKELIEIVQNGIPYAYLVPASAAGCNSHELAADWAETKISEEDRTKYAALISKGHKALKPLKNPWA